LINELKGPEVGSFQHLRRRSSALGCTGKNKVCSKKTQCTRDGFQNERGVLELEGEMGNFRHRAEKKPGARRLEKEEGGGQVTRGRGGLDGYGKGSSEV